MKVATRTDSSSIERSMFEENQNPTFNSKHDNVDYVNEEDEGTEVETVSPSDHVDAIAKRETRIVCGMRLLMVTILVVSTVLLSFYTHEYLDKTEKEAFVDEFESQANKVLQSIGSSLDLTLGTVDAMAVSMISYARDTDQKWPFVTVPDFAIRATKTRRLAKAVSVTLYNIIEGDQRANWEAYTATHGSAWVNQSVSLQAQDPDYYGPNYFDFYTADYIHDDLEEPVPDRELYLPMWQSSPCIPEWAPYNWDGLSWSDTKAYDAVLDTKHVIISEAYHLPDPENPVEVEENEVSAAWYGDVLGPNGHDPSEPITDIYYPLLDTTNEIYIENPAKEKIVAFFALSIYWRKFIEGVLPDTARGVVVVFSSPCNPTFTFQINGPQVKYLGRGDLHDTDYDDMEVSSTLLDLSGLDEGNSFYSGIPIDKEYCPVTIHIFPSKLKEKDYLTEEPLVFSLVVAGIFCFTSLVFVMYDCATELRQKRVMRQATTSTNMVASLFPKAFRDRLYEEAEEKRKQDKSSATSSNNNREGGKRDLSAWHESHRASVDLKTKPIADLFEHTTIFFADLVQFTQWSSNRSPADVFTLLETIYGAFDEIALRRHVFKVETIGDCYVAVTGIPHAQKDHAVIMVRFAQACLHRLQEVLANDLAVRLGPDVLDINMRVGLHSGPTTAGVLRGIKGRFQLFGDTVNTAARMESTGQPGRIQMSQATADELLQRGKGHWLVQRTDPVQAKGKGLMTTYFAVSRRESSGGTNGRRPSTCESSIGDDSEEIVSNNESHESSDEELLGDGLLPPLEPGTETEVEDEKELQEHLSGYLARGSLGNNVDYFI